MEDVSKKSFVQRWWPQRGTHRVWIGIIIIVLVIAGLWLSNKKNNTEDKSKLTKSDKDQNISLSDDLPACPADTSELFTKPFMDGDKPDYIVPLGNSNMEGHVVPVDHVYPKNNTYQEDTPVYAPGKLTLIWIENKQIFNANTDEKVAPDYQLNFAPCRGINLAFIHLTKLSDKLSEALTQEVDENCDTSQKIDFGTRNGAPIYYITCHPDFKQVTLEPGELIGYFGFQDTEKPQIGFDIGIYDYIRPALAFINPDRYYDDTVHTSCFTDYYTPELRAKYNAKFGSIDQQKDGMMSAFIRRTTEPVCGQVMWDVAGTAAGDWFKNPVQKQNITDNDALVLIHDNIQPEMAKMSMAGVTSFVFTPIHSGTINREFSEVTADGKIYCYQSDNNIMNSDFDKEGKPVTSGNSKYLLQMVDEGHIKAEAQSGVCGSSETFASPTTYER